MHGVELANIIRDFYFHCYSRVEKYSTHFSKKHTLISNYTMLK